MRIARIGTLALFVLAASCGKDATGPATPTLPNGTFAMRVDGQPFAAISAAVVVSGNIIGIGTADGASQAFGMAWSHDALRTYTIGPEIVLNANYTSGSGAWLASIGAGSGSITVTTFTANRVAGTFTFVMQPSGSGASGTRTITEGSFDLTF